MSSSQFFLKKGQKTTYNEIITKSIWPESRIILNNQTPKVDPTKPPANSIAPILKSTLLLLACAKAPETEEPTIWFASVATATAGGIPIKISIGVIKKPPPIPNKPDKMPTEALTPSKRKISTEISAIGRKIVI